MSECACLYVLACVGVCVHVPSSLCHACVHQNETHLCECMAVCKDPSLSLSCAHVFYTAPCIHTYTYTYKCIMVRRLTAGRSTAVSFDTAPCEVSGRPVHILELDGAGRVWDGHVVVHGISTAPCGYRVLGACVCASVCVCVVRVCVCVCVCVLERQCACCLTE